MMNFHKAFQTIEVATSDMLRAISLTDIYTGSYGTLTAVRKSAKDLTQYRTYQTDVDVGEVKVAVIYQNQFDPFQNQTGNEFSDQSVS